eukprot:CAMPEP_0113621178 /NCGR_PEP_ID=MMETSP0017_2-20120614/10814_1 /TAXON_ID=2856 /ORGANISM="Cylindrotheca closterium" /LENGTH=474 /DNA_ID=CAMNT_0000530901 /DNA_START=68 /DNA_END=1495 /DNA_ORIENTATION=- /assembly_acc=CAM_ASM_000147
MMPPSFLLPLIILYTQLQNGHANRLFQSADSDPMHASPTTIRVSRIKSQPSSELQNFRDTENEYYPRYRKSYANFRSSNSILSLLDCVEPPARATAAPPLLKSFATATPVTPSTASPVAPIIKSVVDNPLDIAFETMQPTVMITLAPVQPVTMQPIVAGPSLDAPVSIKSSSKSGLSSLKSSNRASIKSATRRRWNPWERNTYYPRYRKSLLQTREPLGTLQPRLHYLGSRHIIINDTKSPRRSPLSKSAMRKPPKGLVIRNTFAPNNLAMRTVGPRAAGRFVRPGTIAPIGIFEESTDAPVNPFPRNRRSGFFSIAPRAPGKVTLAPRAPGKVTSAPVPKLTALTAMPIAAPTWAPFPRYRRSRACIELSRAPIVTYAPNLSRGIHVPLIKGTHAPLVQGTEIKSNPALLFTSSPLAPLVTSTNAPLVTSSNAPIMGSNMTSGENLTVQTEDAMSSPIYLANAIISRKRNRRQ